MMRNNLIVLLLLCATAGGLAGAGVLVFLQRDKQMDAKRQAIEAAWREVDARIDERADLLPRLAETLAHFAPRRGDLPQRIRSAKAELDKAGTPAERIAANDALDEVLPALQGLGEHASRLAADGDFRRLQDALATAETRLSAGRRKYNEAVQDYNTYVQLFPNTLVAWVNGFERESAYFRTSEEARQGPPPVRFREEEPPAADANPPAGADKQP